jgi:hypothetical protein
MAVNRSKLVETARTDYLRAARRIHSQNKEVALATGAQERAAARLVAAQEKVGKYENDQAEALEVLEMLKAEVPEFVPEDVDETEETDTKTEENENASVPEAVTEENDENQDSELEDVRV